jgi:signal transduction histidine kinase
MVEIMQNMKAGSLDITKPESRSLTQMAWVAAILTLVMLLVGVGMVAASFSANGGTINLSTHIYFFPLIAIVFGIMSLLILNHHPRHTVGWLYMVVGFMAGLHFLVNAYMAFDEDVLLGNPDTALHIANLLNHIVWWPVLVLPFTLVLLYFPDGKLLSPRWRIVVFATAAGLFIGILTAFHPGPIPAWGITEPNPAGIKGSERLLETLGMIYLPLLLFAGLGSLISVIIRFRRSTGVERMQMKWLVYSTLVSIVLLSLLNIITYFSPDSLSLVRLSYILGPLLIMIIPVTCGIAIIRHRLWDIDIIINRTLVYGSLTALVVAIYVVIVGGIGVVFQTRTSALNGLIAAGIIAVLFQPLRDRLQRSVNRLLYGERDDPAAVLTRLAHHSETAETPTAVLPNLVRNIAHTLKIPYVAIQLPVNAGHLETVADWGEKADHVLSIPLTFQNELIGDLIVAPRGPGEQFNRQEQDLLATIAALTATTVRAVQLSDELRQSRQRIVTAREEERRRLRRDLHDGLGPQLASQTLGLEAVAQLMGTNPEKAQSLLDSLKTQAQDAILDVRRLVYNLRPPALDDLGLVGALRQSASHYQTGTLRFSFDVPATLSELPAAVETAAYRIAQEAMTNVVHHAGATRCTVRLFCTDEYVFIEVRDDGRGLPQNHQTGVGLQAMKERTTELNGEFVIESLPEGGTLVQARLPLEVYGE